MIEFNIGDWVYAGEWCYGQITELTDDGVAFVEFETYGGGGCMSFDIEELHPAKPPEPARDIELLDIDKIVDALFELLEAYDRSVCEDIQYADLAETWVDALNSDEYNEQVKTSPETSEDILKDALRKFILSKCK